MGIFMTLFYLDEELLALMEDFYTLTGIKIVLFDTHYNELIAYPKNAHSFCSNAKPQAKLLAYLHIV